MPCVPKCVPAFGFVRCCSLTQEKGRALGTPGLALLVSFCCCNYNYKGCSGKAPPAGPSATAAGSKNSWLEVAATVCGTGDHAWMGDTY